MKSYSVTNTCQSFDKQGIKVQNGSYRSKAAHAFNNIESTAESVSVHTSRWFYFLAFDKVR